MPKLLHLDDARFGRILPASASMLKELAGLLEARGQIPCFDAFLQEGGIAWPSELRDEFPGLSNWRGLAELRGLTRRLAGVSGGAAVVFAHSSWQLLRFACSELASRAEHILCSDLDWPEFRKVLVEEAQRAGSTVRVASLQDAANSTERAELLANAWTRFGCDGVFLTSVSSDGAVIDMSRLAGCLNDPVSPECVVIDGAQHAGHLPVESLSVPTIILGGTHKWLRAGVPLSFAAASGLGTKESVHSRLRRAIRSGSLDDATLIQTAELPCSPSRQTLRIDALLAAEIAIRHALDSDVAATAAIRMTNARRLSERLHLPTHYESAILRVECHHDTAEAHARLRAAGVSVTLLDDDHLRIACPAEPLSDSDIERISCCLALDASRWHRAEADPTCLDTVPDRPR